MFLMFLGQSVWIKLSNRLERIFFINKSPISRLSHFSKHYLLKKILSHSLNKIVLNGSITEMSKTFIDDFIDKMFVWEVFELATPHLGKREFLSTEKIVWAFYNSVTYNKTTYLWEYCLCKLLSRNNIINCNTFSSRFNWLV